MNRMSQDRVYTAKRGCHCNYVCWRVQVFVFLKDVHVVLTADRELVFAVAN